MSIQDLYQAYEDAFEESFVDDDWSRVERCFAEDAVHESDPFATGRAAVIAKLKAGVDGFDRKMDTRSAAFHSHVVTGNTFENHWTVTYQKAGAPDLTISGRQILVFDDNLISRFRGVWDPDARTAMNEWMATNGSVLQQD
jgi:hypothetical protein